MVIRSVICAALIAVGTVPAAAAPAEIDYPRHSLGFAAMKAGDYVTAEAQLRALNGVEANDPARLINLGQLLIRTGRHAEGAALLDQARKAEDIDLVLANGRTMSSRDIARRALASVTATYAGR
jgi:hypothetical protein